MINTFLNALSYLIIIFGIVHVTRLTAFAIGSHIYTPVTKWRNRKISAAAPLSIAVVIPAYNEERTILRCLQSVAQASYNRAQLQIIVADDGSKDDTVKLVREFLRANPEQNITLLSRPNAGKAHALNHAIREYAEADLVMCLDADSQIAADALFKAAAHFQDQRVVALSANVKIIPSSSILNLMQVYEYIVNYHVKRALTIFNIEYIIGGIGSTFRRSALETVDFYDTDTITEDIDLTMKLLQLGNKNHRIVYGADVVAYTEAVLTFKDLLKQRFRWKYGRLQTFLKNSDLFFSPEARHAKQLTWFYLPYIVLGEIMFFLEPLMVLFLFLLAFMYGDWITIASAGAIMSSYMILSIVSEDTLTIRTKIKLAIAAPAMYVLFYALNAVEYVALIKTYINVGAVRKSIISNACKWEHVERACA